MGYHARAAGSNKHRDALELAASAKYQRGQLEESGAVILEPGDLRTSISELLPKVGCGYL
jgi:hypothetical protein